MNKTKVAIGVVALVALMGIGSQLTVVALGDEDGGATVLVWRSGPLRRLNPIIDSDRAACTRLMHDQPELRYGPRWVCEGALWTALRGPNTLLRLPFSRLIANLDKEIPRSNIRRPSAEQTRSVIERANALVEKRELDERLGLVPMSAATAAADAASAAAAAIK